MAQPTNSTRQSPVPGVPVIQSFPTPNLEDRIYIVRVDTRVGGFSLPTKGDEYKGPEASKYTGFLFATSRPSDQIGWVDLFYINDRLNQDEYNFTIEYPWVSEEYPRVSRTYVKLRSDLPVPQPAAPDSVYSELVLVDFKITRAEDPVLDALFVGLTTVYERLPASTSFSADRADSVLPFNMRVAVPAEKVSGPAQGAAEAPVLTFGDWQAEETATTAFRKVIARVRRNLPDEGKTLIGTRLTRDKQLGTVTATWKEGEQSFTPRVTLEDAEVVAVGDGSTILQETEVPVLHPDRKFSVQIDDPLPAEFRDLAPTRTQSEIVEGQPVMPELAAGELAASEEAVDSLAKRVSRTDRDLTALPITRHDYELGGVQTHGSEFGGILDHARTISDQPLEIEEGFEVLKSQVNDLGHGFSFRKTTRLSTGGAAGGGPYLELTDPGEGYVDDPAVVFSLGDRGSGAFATAVLAEVPIGGGDLDPGGVFPLTFDSFGDTNGLFTFLGNRYSSEYQNPTPAITTIKVKATGVPSNLAVLTGHDATANVVVTPRSDGSNHIDIDLGPGRYMKVSYITFTKAATASTAAQQTTVRVRGYENPALFRTQSADLDVYAITIASSITLPAAGAASSTGGACNPTFGFRYLRIEGRDSDPGDPPLILSNIEVYGELTVVPAVELNWAFNGDEFGVFNYLGKRGGGGTWRNPHTGGDLTISAPYDTLSLGDFDSVVDAAPSDVCLVNRPSAEIWVDFGEERSLLATTLAYRQRENYDSSCTRLILQGSLDGNTWSERQEFTVSGTKNVWTKIDLTKFTTHFRYYRLTLPDDRSFFSIGELELYGSLFLFTEGDTVTPTYSITGVQIVSGGVNYAEAPSVSFSGGGGSGAAGTAVVEDGVVIRVDLTSAGSGYTSAPDVALTVPGGGSGAEAEATLIGGVVTSIAVTNGGSGFTEAPIVKIVSASGSGATATAVLTGGVVTSIVVGNGGSGYLRTPTVVVYPVGSPEADAEIGFVLGSVVVTAGGSGYTSPPVPHIVGDGTGASLSSTLGFAIASVNITEGGDGYTSAPTPVFAGDGSGAAGTASIGREVDSVTVGSGGASYLTVPEVAVSDGDAQFQAVVGRPLLSIVVTTQGSGFTSDPDVLIIGDGVVAATAHAVRSFGVDTIAVGAGGSGYTVAPIVTVALPTGANGVRATAVAVLTADAVTAIVVTDPGFGYLTAPAVSFAGDGTGATGTAALAAAGAINSVVVDTAGSGYSVPPQILFASGGGTGESAAAVLNTSAPGPVVAINILVAGEYVTAPTLTILPGTTGGAGATATAVLSSTGRVVSVEITDGGIDYTANSPVTFTGGGGSGATGIGVRATTGSVKTVTLLTPGSGYRSDATVEFIGGGGGSGAAALLLPGSCGEVVNLTLTEPGGPFTVAPEVIFVGGLDNGGVVESIPAGPLGWWPMEESGGGNREDVVHGVALVPLGAGSVAQAAGQVGFQAEVTAPISFLGNITIPDPLNWTVFGWIDPIAKPTNPLNYYRSALVQIFFDSDEYAGILFDFDLGTATASIADGAAPQTVTVSGPVEGGDRAFFLLECRNGLLGIQIDNGPMTNVSLPITTWLPNWVFGFETSATQAGAVVGYDEVAVYPAVLTNNQKAQLFNSGVGVTWPIDFSNEGAAGWVNTGAMSAARRNHSAVTLADGRVLVAGGYDPSQAGLAQYLASAEIYDPVSGTWSATGSMNTSRYDHSAVLMADGNVLVTGGSNGTGPGISDTAEIWDAGTGLWTLLGVTMSRARAQHSMVLLDNGDILVICGTGSSTVFDTDLYTGGVFVPQGLLSKKHTARQGGAVLLPSGEVLAGTFTLSPRASTYELWDPNTGNWTLTGTPTDARDSAPLVMLADDTVLVTGGRGSSTPQSTYPKASAIYDPSTGLWAATGSLTTGRTAHAVVPLPDGTFLTMGGYSGSPDFEVASVEIFDPATGLWTAGRSMSIARDGYRANVLDNGDILVSGGNGSVPGASNYPVASCVLYVLPDSVGCDTRTAAALYKFGTTWPVLLETQTDPTEGIRIEIEKSIVPAGSVLPAGYVDHFPLDKYRTIQIVSAVDLHSLPAPDTFTTTQRIALPRVLVDCYPVWNQSSSDSTAGGLATGTQRGAVAAKVQVHGSIVLKTLAGFSGAANAIVERQFFFGAPPPETVPVPTIIQPATGTASITGGSQGLTRKGLTYTATGQGSGTNDFASYASSGRSAGATIQVVDIPDVLTNGFSRTAEFTAVAAARADVLNVAVEARGTFRVDIPASTPTIMTPGSLILHSSVVEKWRFGLYVRTLIYILVPAT